MAKGKARYESYDIAFTAVHMFSQYRMIVVRLMSAAGTGFFYTVRKPRLKEKMVLRKYDPVVRQHVLFVEQKKK